MRHISPRWIYIILGVLLLAVSDYVSSALPLIAGVLLLVYGIYGEREIPGEVSDEEYRITEEEHYYKKDDEG